MEYPVSPQTPVVGETLTLTCDVCMFPIGQYVWTLDGFPIGAPHYKQGNKLFLTPFKTDDYGNYTCRAVNTVFDKTFRLPFTIEVPRPISPSKYLFRSSAAIIPYVLTTCEI